MNLVIVGGGIAGLTAALRSVELGLSTVVLEQGTDERYPCNSRFSGGILHAAHLDVTRPAEELAAGIAKAALNTADPELTRAVADDGRRLLSWLRGNGVRFMRFSTAEAHRWGMAPPRPVAPGLDWYGRGPDVMLRELTERFKTRGGQIILGARAEELDLVDGQIAGLRYRRGGEDHGLRAGAVILADGGFQANIELLRTHIGPAPEKILQRGAANGRGDGLRMAIAAGAATGRLNRFYGHLLHRGALTDSRLWPYPEVDALSAAGIVVDQTGHRFTDEGQGGIAIANATARLADPTTATAIFDTAIWNGPGRSGRLPANPFVERFGGTIQRAPTLEGVAELVRLPVEAVRDTVAKHNAAVAAGSIGTLSPPRSMTKSKPFAIETAPFCALPLCVGITYTMGGIEIDGSGRVLRPDRSPIAGLYAAGATTTGLEGGGTDGVGYVGGLIKAVFGLRAAEAIANSRTLSSALRKGA